MISSGVFLLLLLWPTFCTAAATTAKTVKFTNIVSFGDSISDNGRALALIKAANVTYTQDPAYYKGRFSNGPTWVENLAAAYGVPLSGYAVGGSTSNNTHVRCPNFPGTNLNAPSADIQVGQFLANTSDPARHRLSTTLFTIWTGTNDIQYAPWSKASGTTSTVQNLIGQLRAAGGKQFLVVNLYDLSKVPIAGVAGYLGVGFAFLGVILDPLLASFSKGMSSGDYTVSEKTDTAYFSAYDLFHDFQSNPKNYGFDPWNIQTACLTPAGILNQRNVCADPTKFIYWDTLHPTARTHQIIAQNVQKTLTSYFS